MTKPKTRHRTGAAEAMNPDSIRLHRFIVLGVLATLAAAVATSWNGLIFVADWQRLPAELRWLTPVMVDVPLVVLTFARGALRKRGIRTPGLAWGIVALTFYSSTANLLHTLDGADLHAASVWFGATTNALAPWLILSMTEVLWLVVTRPIRPRAKSRAKAKTRRAPAAAARQAPAIPPPSSAPTLVPGLFS